MTSVSTPIDPSALKEGSEENGLSRDHAPSTEKATPKSAPAFKAPYETPDEVISGSQRFYGKPTGFHGPEFWTLLVRKLLRRKPITQYFLLRVTYRDYQERTTVASFEPGVIADFVSKLLEAPEVRAVECAEMLFKGRKSFGADYDPAHLFSMLGVLAPKPDDGAGNGTASTTEASVGPGMNNPSSDPTS